MEIGTILTATIAAFTGIVGSVLTYLATRPKSRADADLTSAQGFKMLTEELRKERVQLVEQIEKQAGQIERQSEEITKLRREVVDLRGDLGDILERWRRGDPPPGDEPKGNR